MVVTHEMELLSALESTRARDLETVRSELAGLLSNTRDAWLVHGLVNYQVRTGSTRAAEVLVRCPEWHARHVLDKLAEGVRGESRGGALALLGHIVRRQPLWIYQIASHPLMSLLLKVLMTERDIAVLMSGLLTLVTLLPMIPSLVGKHFNEILDVMKRLAAWDTAWSDSDANTVTASRRAHLQLGLYALFYNMYGMYPCSLLEFLRKEYGGGNTERREIFNHTIRPMLDNVRLHPLLITATKQQETQGGRFQKMEHHDILYECRRFSLEGSERPIASAAVESQFRARCGTDVADLAASSQHIEPGKASTSAPNLTEAQTNTKTTLTTSQIDPNSMVYMSKTCDVEPGSERWFCLADSCAGTTPSAPQTPLPTSYGDVPTPRTPLAHLHESLEGGSPPEAAIEATPENTPIKEVGVRKFNFPRNSTAVRTLSNNLQHRPSLVHIQPAQSQPPSPLKKETSPFSRFGEEPQDQRGSTRLNRIVNERVQVETAVRQPSSPQKKFYSQAGSVPNSPVPIGVGPSACGPKDWPVAKPQPKRDGIYLDNVTYDLPIDSNKEDREVTELMRSAGGAPRDDSETPRGPSEPPRGPSEAYAEDWTEDDTCGVECQALSHGLHMPSTLTNLKYRPRYYSQCGPDRPETGSLPAARPPLRYSNHACISKVSSCPDLLSSKNKTSDMQTQTVETWPAAYELNLSEMFVSRRHATPAHPNALALCEQLDKYIEELVRSPASQDLLAEQLQLTYAQLQYERHRKEVHATRNRRLLGKCRKNRTIEERSAELEQRLRILTAENEELRAAAARQSAEAAVAAAVARDAAAAAADRLAKIEGELAKERRIGRDLAADLAATELRAGEHASQTQHLLATQFELGARLDKALRAGEASDRLSECVRVLQREVLMCGERESRLADAVSCALPASTVYLERLLQQYKDEAAAVQETLAASAIKLDMSTARQAELEATIVIKDSVIVDLKKCRKTMQDEHEARAAALDEKYACLRRINQKLECRILELLGRARTGATSGGGASAQSSPMSASVASEGLLGSQVALSDVANLHSILDQPGASNSTGDI